MHKVFYLNIIKQAILFILSLFFVTTPQLYAGDSDFETEGYIESIGEDSLVVNGYIFYVGDETEIKDDTGDISFSVLQIDDYVEVEGDTMGNGHFYAEKIERENRDDDGHDDDDNHELKTEGLISEIYDDVIVVNSYAFKVTESTEIEGHDDANITFNDLSVDMNVKVEGEWQADTALIAKEIELRENDFENEIEFSGTIDSVLSSSIVINNYEIIVTSGTLIEMRHDVLGTLQDLQPGMLVEVKAGYLDSVIIASRIKVENEHENEIELTGTIDSVGTDFIRLLGYHVVIGNNTEITNYAKDSLSISDLQKGLRVNVKGSLVEDKTIHARRIKVKRFHQQEVEFTGAITAISEGQIQVEQTLFFTDSSTIVMDNNNNVISIDQLIVGLLVEIKGRARTDGGVWAIQIKIEDRNNDEIEFTGVIENLFADSITVSGFTFFVDEMTIVMDLQGNPIFFSDIEVGDLIQIKAVIQLNGSFRAVRIKIEDTPGLIVVSGPISNISDDFVSIDGPQFQFIEGSVVLDADYQETTISQYNTGEVISLFAIVSGGDGTPVILQSKLIANSTLTNLSTSTKSQNVPQVFELKTNYPNPFNPETTIRFTINNSGFSQVRLHIYDITGRLVKTLFNGILDKGDYGFKWNGENDFGQNVASGMYIYQLTNGMITLSRKMTLLQ